MSQQVELGVESKQQKNHENHTKTKIDVQLKSIEQSNNGIVPELGDIVEQIARSLEDAARKFDEGGRMTFAQVGGLLNFTKILVHLKYDADSVLANEEEILHSSRAMAQIGYEMKLHELLWEILSPQQEPNSGSETIRSNDIILLLTSLLGQQISKRNLQQNNSDNDCFSPFLKTSGQNTSNSSQNQTFEDFIESWKAIVTESKLLEIISSLIPLNQQDRIKRLSNTQNCLISLQNKSSQIFNHSSNQISKKNYATNSAAKTYQQFHSSKQFEDKSTGLSAKEYQKQQQQKQIYPPVISFSPKAQGSLQCQPQLDHSYLIGKRNSYEVNKSLLFPVSPIKRYSSASRLFSSSKKEREAIRKLESSSDQVFDMTNSSINQTMNKPSSISSKKTYSQYTTSPNKSNLTENGLTKQPFKGLGRSKSQSAAFQPHETKTILSPPQEVWKQEVIAKWVAKQSKEWDHTYQKGECTFKPTINQSNSNSKLKRSQSNSNNPTKFVVDRLYDCSTPQKREMVKFYHRIETECQELSKCSFNPQLIPQPANYQQVQSRIPRSPSQIIISQQNTQQPATPPPANLIKGFDSAVSRMKRGQLVQLQANQSKNIYRSSPTAKNDQKQMFFSNQHKSAGNKKVSPQEIPFFTANITLASGKKQQITLSEGDDPTQIAANFAKKFQLNQFSHQQLHNTLIQQYKEHALQLIYSQYPHNQPSE